jgi:hypothetical protein
VESKPSEARANRKDGFPKMQGQLWSLPFECGGKRSLVRIVYCKTVPSATLYKVLSSASDFIMAPRMDAHSASAD